MTLKHTAPCVNLSILAYFHSIKQSPSQQLAFASLHLIGRKQNTVMIEERIGIDKRRGKQGEHRKDYLLFLQRREMVLSF